MDPRALELAYALQQPAAAAAAAGGHMHACAYAYAYGHVQSSKRSRSPPGPAAGPSEAGSGPLARRQRPDRVFRLFLASTFEDMHPERDAIRAYALPTLKAMCAKRGLAFVCVDLRWGITDTQTLGGQLIRLCLREVQKCTHFVGLLKGRYGRADVPKEGDVFEEGLRQAEQEFPWVREWADRSLTELEIRAGVLGGEGAIPSRLEAMRGKSLFYAASSALTQASRIQAREDGREEGPQAVQRLENLKTEITNAGLEYPVVEYKDLNQLTKDLREKLQAMLEREYPFEKDRPWLEAERAQHEAFAESRRRTYVRNQEEIDALISYAEASGPEMFVVHGESGCGKSALLANWTKEWANNVPNDLTIVHFIGGSQSSSLLSSLARRINEEVRSRWPDAEPLDLRGSDVEVAGRLRAFLVASASRWPFRVILVLDGLDQLRGKHAVRSLAWLPPHASPKLRILVSTVPGPTLDAAMASDRPHTAREVVPFTEDRRKDVVDIMLKEQGRSLSPRQRSWIVRAEACRNALFLTVLVDELLRRSTHESLGADIKALLACGTEPRDLFRLVLERLAASFGADLVRDVASAILCSRHGMEEGELKSLLRVGDGGPTEVVWTVFWHDFQSLLVCRDGVYHFFHRCTAEAVERQYGLSSDRDPPSSAREAMHARLGEFFADQPASQRRAEEAPWALARGGADCNERLVGILCDADVLARLDRYEIVGLWLVSGRSGEAAARYAAALRKGSEDPEADPDSLQDAGLLLDAMGRSAEGIPFLQDGLELRKKALGPEHRGVATTMHNLAGLPRAQGDYAAARPLYEEALHLKKKALGPEHPSVAASMQDLAVLLQAQGDYAAARPLYEEALELCKKALGPEHPDVAGMMHNLAGLLQTRNDYSGARPLYEEALKLKKKALGPEHPEVATMMQNLATLRHAHGDYAAALSLFKEALELLKKALGSEHPHVARTMQNLAGLLQAQGDYAAARPLYEEALELCKKALGPKHPSVAAMMHNLAGLLQEQGDYVAARPMYEETLRLRVEVMQLGPKHPDVLLSMHGLGKLLFKMGDLLPAIQLLEAAAVGLERTLGPQPLGAMLLPQLEALKSAMMEAVRCDDCGKDPIEGTVWHCIECDDFDLCGGCHAAGAEPKGHKAYHAMTSYEVGPVPSASKRPGPLHHQR